MTTTLSTTPLGYYTTRSAITIIAEILKAHQKKIAPYALRKPLHKDSNGGSNKNVSNVERDKLLAFEEKEKSLPATTPSSTHTPLRPKKPLYLYID